jgi:hypothetical protein
MMKVLVCPKGKDIFKDGGLLKAMPLFREWINNSKLAVPLNSKWLNLLR